MKMKLLLPHKATRPRASKLESIPSGLTDFCSISIVVLLMMFIATAAKAHFPTITADAFCDFATGEVVITYSSTAWEGNPGEPLSRENPQIDILVDGVLVDSGAYVAPDYSFSGDLPKPDGAMTGDIVTVTAIAVARWGNGRVGGTDETTVTIPSDDCRPKIEIEKFTNGYDADDASGFPVLTPPIGDSTVGGTQVPLVEIGDDIRWGYRVTNTGTEALLNVIVTDSEGVAVNCFGAGDILLPGERINCFALGTGLDLSTDPNATIVYGCDAQGMGTPQPAYENVGRVVGTGEESGVEVTDEDPSHYCNPPDVMLEKFTNGHDGDDPNGNPDINHGTFDPGAPSVAEVASGDSITWTYRVTNTGDEPLENIMVSDSRGVDVSCPLGPQDTLAPGETITCTATGSADDLEMTGGDVAGCDGFGTGETRPTYENIGSVVAQGTNSGLVVEDDDLSHYCNPDRPPECGLTVEKTCELPPPPIGVDDKCEGRLAQFTMIWDGPSGIQVSGPANDAPGTINTGDVVTFFGPFSDNDVVVGISGAISGESTFHTSCSDRDMDGETASNDQQEQVSSLGRDCGKFEGNGKSNDGGINQWLLEGFVDDDGAVLDCTSDPAPGLTSCEFTPAEASCETLGKPSNLTLVYTGGGCPGNNTQGGKADCSGSIDSGLPVTVTLDGGTLGSVSPGESFVIPTTGSNTTVVLSNSGGTQTNDIHTSCSAPLVAGESFGGLTLIALDGVGNGTEVTYAYLVSNQGPVEVTGISVTDDQLGSIGTIASLQPGASQSLSATAFITETTTNTATVNGVGAPGAVCTADSNPVVVTALPPPPCSASIAFKEVKDDAIKWTLSNGADQKATMETFQLDFPSGFTAIKEVKLDGGVFKSGDSSTYPDGVASGELIGSSDWTESDGSKRQLDEGESRTLEVKFETKLEDASPSDFDLTVTFGEGCMVEF